MSPRYRNRAGKCQAGAGSTPSSMNRNFTCQGRRSRCARHVGRRTLQKGRPSRIGPDLRLSEWRGHCRIPSRPVLRRRKDAGSGTVHMQPPGAALLNVARPWLESPETQLEVRRPRPSVDTRRSKPPSAYDPPATAQPPGHCTTRCRRAAVGAPRNTSAFRQSSRHPTVGQRKRGLDLDARSTLQNDLMSTRSAIQIAGLLKSYGDLEVLRGVDFDVAPGSIFALLGSNGAGKTTVVKILSTLLKADGGTAAVDGFDVVTQAAKVRESISLTGQFAAVDEILTGRENLVLVAKLRHLDIPAAIADDLLARFSLTDAGRAPGRDLLRRHAPPSRHRDEPDRRPAGDLPRRADDRPRSAGAPRGVAGRSRSSPHTARRCCSPRSTWMRPSSSPTGSRSSTRAGSSSTARSPSSRRCCRPPRSSTSRSSRRSKTSSSRSSATKPRHRGRRRTEGSRTMNSTSSRDTDRAAGPLPASHPAQPRHDHHHRDHADRHAAAVRLRLRRRDQHGRRQVRGLPAPRHPAHHGRVRHRLHRLTGCSPTSRAASSSGSSRCRSPARRCCGGTC